MKKLGSIVIVGLILIAPLAAKLDLLDAHASIKNDALLGEITQRITSIGESSPYNDLQLEISRDSKGKEIHQISFSARGSYSSIPNGLILNLDGERTILRTKDNGVRLDWENKLQYNMNFIVDKATFEKIAGAKKLLEFTAMIDDKYFTPTTVNGKDLTNFTQQVARIISDEELPALY